VIFYYQSWIEFGNAITLLAHVICSILLTLKLLLLRLHEWETYGHILVRHSDQSLLGQSEAKFVCCSACRLEASRSSILDPTLHAAQAAIAIKGQLGISALAGIILGCPCLGMGCLDWASSRVKWWDAMAPKDEENLSQNLDLHTQSVTSNIFHTEELHNDDVSSEPR
jgi:hypothetical protein